MSWFFFFFFAIIALNSSIICGMFKRLGLDHRQFLVVGGLSLLTACFFYKIAIGV
jgi:hypothetical protein